MGGRVASGGQLQLERERVHARPGLRHRIVLEPPGAHVLAGVGMELHTDGGRPVTEGVEGKHSLRAGNRAPSGRSTNPEGRGQHLRSEADARVRRSGVLDPSRKSPGARPRRPEVNALHKPEKI